MQRYTLSDGVFSAQSFDANVDKSVSLHDRLTLIGNGNVTWNGQDYRLTGFGFMSHLFRRYKVSSAGKVVWYMVSKPLSASILLVGPDNDSRKVRVRFHGLFKIALHSHRTGGSLLFSGTTRLAFDGSRGNYSLYEKDDTQAIELIMMAQFMLTALRVRFLFILLMSAALCYLLVYIGRIWLLTFFV